MSKTVYFDNNATTQVAPEVRDAILPFLGELYGNPSSMHAFGGQVAKYVDQAREEVARIVVEDHGIGIPPGHAEELFERFHRVDPARASETGGAGLGLAIVRRIARLHGGDVAYVPVQPHGCCFILTVLRLPIEKLNESLVLRQRTQ